MWTDQAHPSPTAGDMSSAEATGDVCRMYLLKDDRSANQGRSVVYVAQPQTELPLWAQWAGWGIAAVTGLIAIFRDNR